MKNFDGVNFGCSCGGYHYRKDPKRERWLVEHGSKTCFVCGRVALQPGMLPDNGNGHICIHCAAEYEHDESTGRADLYPLSGQLKPKPDHRGHLTIKRQLKPNHQGHVTLKVSTVFFLILMVYLAGCAVIVKAEAESIDIYFKADPMFADINDPVNIADMTREETVIGEWERDFNGNPPNGTYYGPFLPPAQFVHNLIPTWIKNETNTNLDGRYTFVLISAHFNLSRQEIMAGASEWWLRTPLDPSSIEAFYGLTVSIFKNVDNASKVGLLGDFTTAAYARYAQRPRAEYNGYVPGVICVYGPELDVSQSGAPITDYNLPPDMRVANDHLYIQVNAVLEPSVDYVISLGFRLPKDGVLTTYWTSSGSPAGSWTAIDIQEVYMHPPIGGSALIDELDSVLIEIPLDLDWSFIFTEGVGMGGLFGKRINIPAFSMLGLYPFWNTSMEGAEYISVMLPWISDESAYIHPTIWPSRDGDIILGFFNGSGPDYFYPVRDSPLNITIWGDWYDAQGYNYTDFCLFSTDRTVNWTNTEPDDRWRLLVGFMFMREVNLTLLCYEEDREPQLWSTIDLSNTSRNPLLTPHIYYYGTNWSSLSEDWNISLNYNIWCSVRGTTGQWAMRNGTASGRATYTHYFPRIIRLSSAQWKVVNETKEEIVIPNWGLRDVGLIPYAWDRFFGDDDPDNTPVGTLIHVFQEAIMKVWNGLSQFGGWVLDGLSQVWDALKRFGQFIYAAIVEFIGMIWNFIGDVVDTIAGFWDTLKFLVAPFMFISIVVGGSKISKKLMTGRGD